MGREPKPDAMLKHSRTCEPLIMNINIASWNINSIRARETSLQKWIVDFKPDIIGLQETKVVDDQFPAEFFYKNGFDVRFFGQKSYNGVCLAFKRRQSN